MISLEKELSQGLCSMRIAECRDEVFVVWSSKTFVPTLIDKIIYLSRNIWITKNGKHGVKITLKPIDKNNNDHQVGGCTLLD